MSLVSCSKDLASELTGKTSFGITFSGIGATSFCPALGLDVPGCSVLGMEIVAFETAGWSESPFCIDPASGIDDIPSLPSADAQWGGSGCHGSSIEARSWGAGPDCDGDYLTSETWRVFPVIRLTEGETTDDWIVAIVASRNGEDLFVLLKGEWTQTHGEKPSAVVDLEAVEEDIEWITGEFHILVDPISCLQESDCDSFIDPSLQEIDAVSMDPLVPCPTPKIVPAAEIPPPVPRQGPRGFRGRPGARGGRGAAGGSGAAGGAGPTGNPGDCSSECHSVFA